jgi:hypothetical protein
VSKRQVWLGWNRGTSLVLLAWGATLALLVYRVQFGVSHRDEAFYSAMPYSFALGTRPFFDELAIHQNAAILMTPLYRAYLAIAGSADGIILFNRYAYVGYLAVCAWLGYRYVRSRAGRAAACAAALLILVFSYCNLFALSYNTLGAMGFFAGAVLSAGAVAVPRPATRLVAAGAFFLSAMFAYPGLAPAVLVYALVIAAWFYRCSSSATFRSALIGLGASAVCTVIVALGVASWIGRAGFERLLEFSRSMGYGRGNSRWWEGISAWRGPVLGFAAVLVAWPLLTRRFPRLAWLIALLGVVVSAWLYEAGLRVAAPTPATLLLCAMPVLAPACVLAQRDERGGRELLALIWLPGILAMLCCTFTSANRYQAASLGALLVELAGVIAFARLCSSAEGRTRSSGAVALSGLAGSLFLLQTHSLFAAVYADDPSFAANDTRVRRGPMRGIRTTPFEAKRLAAVDADLKATAREGRTITVFDGFATGYLSTKLRPHTFTHWIVWVMTPSYSRAIMRERFGSPELLPDIVLKIEYKGARRFWESYERGHYRVLIDRPEYGYTILKKS